MFLLKTIFLFCIFTFVYTVDFNIYCEWLIILAGAYSLCSKNLLLTFVVSLLASFVMCGLGNRGFVFSVLSVFCFSMPIFMYTHKLNAFGVMFMTAFLYFAVVELIYYFIYYSLGALPAHALLRRIFLSGFLNGGMFVILCYILKNKKKYIFKAF